MNESALSINIYHQGAVKINRAVIEKQSEEIVCISIELYSKYCEIGPITGTDMLNKLGPGASLFATERSTQLLTTVPKDDPTCITFPDYRGWEMYATSEGRYCVRFVLIKSNK